MTKAEELKRTVNRLVHDFKGPVPILDIIKYATDLGAHAYLFTQHGNYFINFIFPDSSNVVYGADNE